jgi:CRISPR-associated endoribonuclease Cas6
MPHAFILELHRDQARIEPPRDLNRYAHGLFFALLERIDPTLSASVHVSKNNPFTLHATANRDRLEMRITTLDDTLFGPLVQTSILESMTGIHVGQDTYRIHRVLATPDGHPRAGHLNWTDLNALPARETATIEFLTPTTFSTSKSDDRKWYTPLPDPRLVFNSLHRRLEHFNPNPNFASWAAGLQELIGLDIIVTKLEQVNTYTHAGKTPLTGFTGRVSFRVMGENPVLRKAFAQWLAFAPYAGVGLRTGYGMGQVRVLER